MSLVWQSWFSLVVTSPILAILWFYRIHSWIVNQQVRWQVKMQEEWNVTICKWGKIKTVCVVIQVGKILRRSYPKLPRVILKVSVDKVKTWAMFLKYWNHARQDIFSATCSLVCYLLSSGKMDVTSVLCETFFFFALAYFFSQNWCFERKI